MNRSSMSTSYLRHWLSHCSSFPTSILSYPPSHPMIASQVSAQSSPDQATKRAQHRTQKHRLSSPFLSSCDNGDTIRSYTIYSNSGQHVIVPLLWGNHRGSHQENRWRKCVGSQGDRAGCRVARVRRTWSHPSRDRRVILRVCRLDWLVGRQVQETKDERAC